MVKIPAAQFDPGFSHENSDVSADPFPIVNSAPICEDMDEDCPLMSQAERIACASYAPELGYCPWMD